MNRILEKLARDGWTVTIEAKKPDGYYVNAEKDGVHIPAYDEYSPTNAIKILDEKIYDEA